MTVETLHHLWRGLPIGTLDEVAGTGPCLILAPHPDDESLGCGGLIAACCAMSRPPVVAILTDGAGSHEGSAAFPPARLAGRRAQEVRHATALLGLPADRLFLLGEPDGRAPSDGPRFTAAVQRITGLLRRFGCTTMLAPWQHDPHGDHVAAARIACAAARAAGVQRREYPVWGWASATAAPAPEGATGWRLDVRHHVPAKRRAIAAHASQHGWVVVDDPNGFRLPEVLLAACLSAWETYLVP